MTAAKSILHLDGHNMARELVIPVPIRVISEANARDHWAKKSRRVKEQRRIAGMLAASHDAASIGFPCTVTLVRIAPSKGLDGDNLQSSMKGVRDGVADALRVDDGHPHVTWLYEQRRGARGEWAVEIRIAGRKAAA